jgi:hypothetical protein
MNRRIFGKKATGFLAAVGAMVGVKAKADVVLPPKKPKTEAPQEASTTIKILNQTCYTGPYPGWKPKQRAWVCEYQVVKPDGSVIFRKADVTMFDGPLLTPPSVYPFDIS